MTSRLKRKLDTIGFDSNSSKLTESFCLIGTPLPSLDKAKDANEFVPVWKQDVRDEQGRRRLHGAFTGGFSAGYFNTVGSKEGWTPATFKSSRASRAANKAARPEDFMDDEDLEEMRNNQKMIDTTEEMDILGGTQAELRNRAGASAPDDDPIASALAASLLPPPRDSAGAQLLKKMGWRLGQGVGPRVTYEQLKKQDQQSSSIPAASSTVPLREEDDDDEAKKHLYAPRDTKVVEFRPKDNAFGLGYVPGAGLSDIIHGQSSKENMGGPNISAGFGLGALNDAEDDDVDVYDPGANHRPSRGLAYDFQDAASEKLTLASRKEEREPLRARQDPSSSFSSGAGTFHDGRPVLSGFVLSDKPVVEDVWFKIPDVPKGWKPNPRKVWEASSAPADNSTTVIAPNVVGRGKPDTTRWKNSGKTVAEERGALLGESGLPDQAPRSIFEYLSQKDRERLERIKAGGEQPVKTPSDDTHPTPVVSASVDIIFPTIEPSIAQAALQGFQPFSTDPLKHSRYTAYIRSQAFPTSSVNAAAPPAPKPGQSNNEFNKEMEDFAKAAMMFKPMSGAMANRFTSASIIESGPKAQEGLHKPVSSSESYLSQPTVEDESTKKEEDVIKETPKQNAARLGMYGPLTRETRDWAPARLLCKRFGIKNPRPDVSAPGTQGADDDGERQGPSGDAAASGAGVSFTPAATEGVAGMLPPPPPPPARSGPKDLANIGLGEDDDQGRDTLTYQRPAMDIFKAIFASDDEDSDDDDEVGEHAKKDDDTLKSSIPSSTADGVGASSTTAISVSLPPSSLPLPSSSSSKPTEKIEEDDVPVDPTSFRPKFVSKAQRDGSKSASNAGGDTSTKKSKSKSKKESRSTKTLVSFDMDVDGDGGGLTVIPDVKKKKKDKEKEKGKKRAREDEGDGESKTTSKKRAKPVEGVSAEAGEDEWVEKPTPTSEPITQPRPLPPVLVPDPGTRSLPLQEKRDPPHKGRMKASDFL